MSNRVLIYAIAAPLLFGLPAFRQEPRLTPRTNDTHPILANDSQAPVFALPGIDDKIHKLSEYKDSKLLVVMFICNHCPTSQLYGDRMKKLVQDYKGKGVVFVAINPNDPQAVTLSQLGYRDVTYSVDDMKIRAEYAALQQKHASSRNRQFASDDTHALQSAIEKKWDAGAPFTMVIAPGGKALYQKQGEAAE